MSGAQPLGVAGLISGTFRLTVAAFGRLFPVAFVPALISTVLAGTSAPDQAAGVTAGLLWSGVADLVLGTLVAGALCLMALDTVFGRRHRLEEYLRQALRHLVPLLVFGLVLSIAIAIGLVFLVVPGIYVAARYLPYVPATVFENAGWQGTSRAEELTRDYRWPLAGAVVGFGVVLASCFVVVGLPVAYLAESIGSLPAILAEAVLASAGYVVLAAFSVVVYLRLRELQEGLSAADLAATID